MTTALRFMGVNKDTRTAGPGRRLEFFTKGCIRGVINPCFGCFNEETWTFEGLYRGMEVDELVQIADEQAWNRQVTFCGGEPILQARALTQAAKRLKDIDPTFHFVMYTAYKLDVLMKYGLSFTWVPKHGEGMLNQLMTTSASFEVKDKSEDNKPTRVKFTILTPNDVQELMKHVDIIVDGDYQMDKRLTTEQYMHEGWFIGSANQRVIFAPETIQEGELIFLHADEYNKQRLSSTHCKACGHDISSEDEYCSETCEKRYALRKEEVALLGGI